MDAGFGIFQTNFQDFSRTLKFTSILFAPYVLMSILLTVCHTFQIFYLGLTDFQNFPGCFSPGKCHNKIPEFPGPVRTLCGSFFFTQSSMGSCESHWRWDEVAVPGAFHPVKYSRTFENEVNDRETFWEVSEDCSIS